MKTGDSECGADETGSSERHLLDRLRSLAVDANMDTHSCTVAYTSTEPWWSVDLGTPMDVGRVCVTNDFDPTYGQRIDVLKKNVFRLCTQQFIIIINHQHSFNKSCQMQLKSAKYWHCIHSIK